MRPAALVAVLALATACGSTVQMTATGSTPGTSTDGLGPASVTQGTGATAATGSTDAPIASTDTTVGQSAAGIGGALAPVPASGGSALPSVGPASDTRTTFPGVTAKAITIGVLAADPQANKTLDNAGFGAASLGDEPASWRAMADEVNSRGGIAGRKVALVFYLVNLTDSPASQGQAACARFTQDSKVALVLSGYYYASLDTCLGKKGVPALLGTNYGVDSQQAKDSRTVVAWATPLLDRIAATLPEGFQRLGKLKAGTTAGVFVTDAPAFTRSAAVLAAELMKRGVKVVTQTVRDSDSGDYAAAANDSSAAVLKFRSSGVTEVLFLTHNAFEPTVLMTAANSQGYTPTYLLSSQQYPNGLVGLAPKSQLANALALGWAPGLDLSSGYADAPQAKRCLATMKKHGRTYSGTSQTLVGLLVCDAFDLVARAAQAPGGLSGRAALMRNALSSSSGFVSAVTIRTSFVGGRRDGVAAYRPMAFSGGCTCFSYTGPASAM